jgi:hypothetical protein
MTIEKGIIVVGKWQLVKHATNDPKVESSNPAPQGEIDGKKALKN